MTDMAPVANRRQRQTLRDTRWRGFAIRAKLISSPLCWRDLQSVPIQSMQFSASLTDYVAISQPD